MKRIAFYIPNLRRGGAERVVSKLSEIMQDDYEVDIILHNSEIEYDVKGRVINMDTGAAGGVVGKLLMNVKRVFRLRAIKRGNNYACVMSFLNNANIINILTKTRNTRSVVSIRNYYDSSIYSFTTRLTTGVLNLLYRYSDQVVPVTHHLARMLKQKGVPAEKITTLYNPFDVDAIRQKMTEPVLTEQEMAFAERPFMFAYVGRLSHQKGIWNLLKAFRRLSSRQNVGLFIVGEGEQLEKIQQYIQQYHMDNVMAVGLKENPFAYIHKAGRFILPSLAEGFPNVIGEALACGAAVISTDCKTGPREILAPSVELESILPEIYEGEYGLLIAPMSNEEKWDDLSADDERMYRAICHYIDSEGLVRNYREKAAERAKDFSYEAAREIMKRIVEGK